MISIYYFQYWIDDSEVDMFEVEAYTAREAYTIFKTETDSTWKDIITINVKTEM